MVQVLPSYNPWGEIGEGLQSGVDSFKDRSDQTALQNTLANLDQNASARDILDAITSTNTYSPKAKQQAVENYIGASKLQEIVRHSKKQEETQQERNRLTAEKGKLKKEERKDTDKVAQAVSGLKKIEEMKALGKKDNLGWGSGVRKYFSSETAKDFGKYEQLGKSLIQSTTNIPIRNRQEFETLAHKLYDPSIRDAEREGILEAVEMILTQAIEETGLLNQPQSQPQVAGVPEGKVKVISKATGKPGTVTPYKGMEAKYDLVQ